MANRVTIAEVEQIIDLDSSISDAVVTVHIGIANRLVTNTCTADSLTAAILKDIELYLSAHFLAMGWQEQTTMEKAGPVSESYAGKTGMHLDYTKYGQTAMMIDTSGALSSLNSGKRIVASITAINPDLDD